MTSLSDRHWAGRLTKGPELRYIADGTIATMTTQVAIEAPGTWGELWEATAFSHVAEKAAERLSEGDRVIITGRPQAGTDRNGNAVTRIIIKAFALIKGDG
jgi:single-stranded DNA-binding protein